MRGGFRWRALITGSIRALIRTRRASAVITALVAAGVPLWNLRRTADGFIATFPTERRVQFHRTLHRFHARPRIIGRFGLLRWLRRVGRRPALIIGILTAAAVVGSFAARIYVVDAPDAGAALERPVLTAAARAGVYPGALRGRINVSDVEHQVLADVPGLSWVGVNIYGGLVLIRIHQVKPPVRPTHASRLVAATAGTVRAVHVYAGQAVVAPGDQVKRGAVLILGQMVVPPADNARPGAPATAIAAGSVLADVQLAARVTIPLTEHYEVRTGNSTTRTWLEVGSWSMLTGGFGPLPYSHYVISSRSERLVWRGVRLPAYLVTVVYNEAIAKTRRLNPKEAARLAQERAMKELSKRFRPGARLVKESVRATTSRRAVTVDVEAVVQENIAEPNAPAGGGT